MCACVYERACASERERERERESVCVCACACAVMGVCIRKLETEAEQASEKARGVHVREKICICRNECDACVYLEERKLACMYTACFRTFETTPCLSPKT